MLTIEIKELAISKELKRKVGMICKFACVRLDDEDIEDLELSKEKDNLER